MMASYSQQSSIEQAFAETFGGERPCELCKLITAVDAEQQSTPAQAPDEGKSLKLLPGQAPRIRITPGHFTAAKRSPTDHSAAQRSTDVPTPPPRRV